MKKLLLLAIAAATPAAAQVEAPRTRSGCVLVNERSGAVTATGVLRRVTFKDPAGRPERVFLLHLPRATCAEDGGEGLLDGRERLADIQLEGSVPARYVGRRVRVTGTAMPRNTGHHHTPLLLIAPLRVVPR